jgi:predicted Zn-ribbon and HTH transcriptional regulator
MIELLKAGPLSARDISRALGIRHKEVVGHLEHVRLSLAASREARLVVEPSRCLGCGHVFRKRTRLTAPSRCPVCRHSHVSEPLFQVVSREGEPRGA